MRRTVIGVMGPGAASIALEKAAFELGRLIAREGWVLLTGGRDCGVMDAASRGAKAIDGSITVGILPDRYQSDGISDAVDIAIFTAMGDARNAINVQSSDVVVAFGAATPGTLSEVALALKAGRHVVVVGPAPTGREFLSLCGGDRIHFADDPADVVAEVRRLLAASQARRIS
jgi:uncharacterized protein (TIGR00725 family)